MLFVVARRIPGRRRASDRIARANRSSLAAGLMGIAALCIAAQADPDGDWPWWPPRVPWAPVSASLPRRRSGTGDPGAADPDHNGQDLGIVNIAMAVPQALGPSSARWSEGWRFHRPVHRLGRPASSAA